MDPALAPGVIDGQIEQAYTKTKIAVAAQGAADLLRQNIMINLVQDTAAWPAKAQRPGGDHDRHRARQRHRPRTHPS
jgi:hypothetical protein